MQIYTIGSTKKSACRFFELIKDSGIDFLLDIRLNNSSQLAGFSKGNDLKYFLSAICGCMYKHDLLFAPTQELMVESKSQKVSIEQFDRQYAYLMRERNALAYFKQHYMHAERICLLCSEHDPTHCHRRSLSELLSQDIEGSSITHLL